VNPVGFVFGVHLHQPVGNFDHVFADHLRDVYRPLVERLALAPSNDPAVGSGRELYLQRVKR